MVAVSSVDFALFISVSEERNGKGNVWDICDEIDD